MRDETVEEHLDGLCEGLLRYRRRGGKIKEGSLVTWRGMLTRYEETAISLRGDS